MSPLLLQTFNSYLGVSYSAAEAIAFVARLHVYPLPERIELDDWRVHVPMHLLEGWSTLCDLERVTVYLMAQSATHQYESAPGPDEPTMN